MSSILYFEAMKKLCLRRSFRKSVEYIRFFAAAAWRVQGLQNPPREQGQDAAVRLACTLTQVSVTLNEGTTSVDAEALMRKECEERL